MTAGAVSKSNLQPRSVTVTVGVATAGTAPYTYQWYRSTTSGFSPGGGNIITGATALSLNDTGLVPGTSYFYKNIATDSAGSPLTATSAQLAVTTPALSQSQNQLAQTPQLGQMDLAQNVNVISCQVDPSAAANLVAGQAVKFTTTAGGAPKVDASLLAADSIAGFIAYNFKQSTFKPGDLLEVAQAGDVIWLMAAAAINRGQTVSSLPAAVAGGATGAVLPSVGSSGLPIQGYALDTVTIGQLVRIKLLTPNLTVA